LYKGIVFAGTTFSYNILVKGIVLSNRKNNEKQEEIWKCNNQQFFSTSFVETFYIIAI